MTIHVLLCPKHPLINNATLLGAGQQLALLVNGLRDRGHTVNLSDSLPYTTPDIVYMCHPFWLECLQLVIEMRNRRIPLVAKSIDWSTSNWMIPLVDYASALTAESPEEASRMIRTFGPICHKIEMTMPGVDTESIGREPSHKYYVHINGQYNDNKNHLAVIEACRQLDLPVITAGSYNDPYWYNQCLDAGYGQVLSVQNKKQLSQIYAITRVYVCASNFEVSSTSVCEAIASKCLVVSCKVHLGNSNYDKPGYWVYDDLVSTLDEAYHSDARQENSYWSDTMLVDAFEKVFTKYQRQPIRKLF